MDLQRFHNTSASAQQFQWQRQQLQQGQQGSQYAEGKEPSSQRRVTIPPSPRRTTFSSIIYDNGYNLQNTRASPMEGQRYHFPLPHNMTVYRPQPADGYWQNSAPAALAGQGYYKQPQNMSHPTSSTSDPLQHPPKVITSDRLRQVADKCRLNICLCYASTWIHEGLADFFSWVKNDASYLTDHQKIFQAGYDDNNRLTCFYLRLKGKPNIMDHIKPLSAQLLTIYACDPNNPAVFWSNRQGCDKEWVVINLNAFLPPQNTAGTIHDQPQFQTHPPT